MIIAYPLEDIAPIANSKAKVEVEDRVVRRKVKKVIQEAPIYQKAGIATLVIAIIDNMFILENKKGERFPANKNRLVWCER